MQWILFGASLLKNYKTSSVRRLRRLRVNLCNYVGYEIWIWDYIGWYDFPTKYGFWGFFLSGFQTTHFIYNSSTTEFIQLLNPPCFIFQPVYVKNGNIFFRTTTQKAISSEQSKKKSIAFVFMACWIPWF